MEVVGLGIDYETLQFHFFQCNYRKVHLTQLEFRSFVQVCSFYSIELRGGCIPDAER
jgi:hypothetical protein